MNKELAKITFEDIFEQWNSKDIIIHKVINTPQLMNLKDDIERNVIDSDKLSAAIDMYDRILKDEDYFFSYKFTLKKFAWFTQLRRGERRFEQFLEGGKHYESYMSFLKKKKKYNIILENLPSEKQIDLDTLNTEYIEMIKKFNSMPYEEYLLTEHWLHFKSEAIANANCKCSVCGSKDNEFQVHHKTYKNRGRETFNDILVLCNKCHEEYHNKLSEKKASRPSDMTRIYWYLAENGYMLKKDIGSKEFIFEKGDISSSRTIHIKKNTRKYNVKVSNWVAALETQNNYEYKDSSEFCNLVEDLETT